MAYTETQHTSYGGRLKNSLGGIGTGFLLFIGATVLLWWNEGRAVKTAKAINETEDVCVEMDNINKVDAQFNGQVVHATGNATTNDSLVDAEFETGAVAVRLTRSVEYYQYVEEKHEETHDNVGGSQDKKITYTYKETWTDSPVNSGEFKDPSYQNKNFVYTNVEAKESFAENVAFGAYKLNEKQIKSISGDVAQDLKVSSSKIAAWNKACIAVAKSRGIEASDSMVHVNGNVVYYGVNPNSPQIGDVKVTFTKVLHQHNSQGFRQYIHRLHSEEQEQVQPSGDGHKGRCGDVREFPRRKQHIDLDSPCPRYCACHRWFAQPVRHRGFAAQGASSACHSRKPRRRSCLRSCRLRVVASGYRYRMDFLSSGAGDYNSGCGRSACLLPC